MVLRRAIRLLLLLIGAATSCLPAVAAPPAPGNPPAQRGVEIRPGPEIQLQALWFARKSALEVGDTAAAAGRIEEMMRLLRAERLDRVPWLARGFAYEGYEHLREGNYERAREAFDIARKLDPRMAEAQTGYAWAALRAGKGLGTFLAEYRRVLLLRWQTLAREGGANIYWIALAAMWLVGVVVVLACVVRYQAMLRHDVAETMPRRWPEGASRLAAWIVLLAPLFLWLGGVWILLFWCVVLARYMSGRERLLAAAICAAVVFSAPLAAEGLSTAEISANPTVLAVEEALQGGYGAGVIHSLQKALQSVPAARYLRLLLGNVYERAGRQREAFDEYQALLKVYPDDAKALNNVGNLYLTSGQTGQAIVYYMRALEVDPQQAAFYHNLFLAQSDALRPADAEASLRRVQDLDPQLARVLVQSRGRSEETPPISAAALPEEVWNDLPRAAGSAPVGLTDYVSSPTSIGALVALLLIGWSSLGRSPLRAQTCMRCGQPFCGRCKKEIGAKEYCAPCIHLFVKRDAIAPEIRAKKLSQVERFTRASRRWVRGTTLALPGAGHLLAGRTLTGTVILAAWSFPLAALLLGPRLMLPPTVPVLDLPSFGTLLTVSFMALVWGAANLLIRAPQS